LCALDYFLVLYLHASIVTWWGGPG